MRITEVAVSALPDGHRDQDVWSVRVAWRGDDRYAVTWMGRVLNVDGELEHEPIPSSRTDEFIARSRFDYDEALSRAVKVAPSIRVNGLTAADVLAREATNA